MDSLCEDFFSDTYALGLQLDNVHQELDSDSTQSEFSCHTGSEPEYNPDSSSSDEDLRNLHHGRSHEEMKLSEVQIQEKTINKETSPPGHMKDQQRWSETTALLSLLCTVQL